MEYTILILALPMFSFLLLGLAGMKMSHKVAGTIGTLSLGIVTVLSYLTAFRYFTAPRTADGTFETLMPWNFEWLPFTESLHIDMGILLDPISVMMLVVISTVSLMVHIYSFGYMKGEVGFQRYYAFLSLFSMSMLGLVVATNIFQMYVFWELVGVSSYLLIGFYYTKPEAIAASKKAFIVTRFADLGFLIGILIYGYYMQTFEFDPAQERLMQAGMVLPLALGPARVPCSRCTSGCLTQWKARLRSVPLSMRLPWLWQVSTWLPACSRCLSVSLLKHCMSWLTWVRSLRSMRPVWLVHRATSSVYWLSPPSLRLVS